MINITTEILAIYGAISILFSAICWIIRVNESIGKSDYAVRENRDIRYVKIQELWNRISALEKEIKVKR